MYCYLECIMPFMLLVRNLLVKGPTYELIPNKHIWVKTTFILSDLVYWYQRI